MIRNEQQLTISKRKLEEARSYVDHSDSLSSEISSLFADEIESEIKEYEAVRDGFSKTFKISTFDDIGRHLSYCRLVRRLTQAELASLLGLKEQQVQRYEASDYQTASLWKVAEVVDALGFEVEGCLRPVNEEPGGIIFRTVDQYPSQTSPNKSSSNLATNTSIIVGIPR